MPNLSVQVESVLPAAASPSRTRLDSLDAFRGATVAAMILVNNPGDWNAVFGQLEHAPWNGWTFTDLVFPSFLYIGGVSMVFSFAGQQAKGIVRRTMATNAIRRALLIYLVGLFMAGFPYFHLQHIRVLGVLPRIAICYFVSSLIVLYGSRRAVRVSLLSLLLGYWLLMALVPVPGFGPGNLTMEGNLSHYVDSLLLKGHMWAQTKTWDPEGTVSTLPAIASMLFGVLAGRVLISSDKPEAKTARLFAAASLLILAGAILNIWLPINKSIWTSSFAVLMAGFATQILAAFYWIIDVGGHRSWAKPFAILGRNALAMFVLSGLFARTLGLLGVAGPLYQTVFAPFAPPKVASVIYAVANVLLFGSIAWFMNKHRWYVRL